MIRSRAISPMRSRSQTSLSKSRKASAWTLLGSISVWTSGAGMAPGNGTTSLIAVPLHWGIELAGHLPQPCREAFQERRNPRTIIDLVRQIDVFAGPLVQANMFAELGGEVSRLVNQAAARGRLTQDDSLRVADHLVIGIARVVLDECIFAGGNLVFRLALDGYATVVVVDCRAMSGDV